MSRVTEVLDVAGGVVILIICILILQGILRRYGYRIKGDQELVKILTNILGIQLEELHGDKDHLPLVTAESVSKTIKDMYDTAADMDIDDVAFLEKLGHEKQITPQQSNEIFEARHRYLERKRHLVSGLIDSVKDS